MDSDFLARYVDALEVILRTLAQLAVGLGSELLASVLAHLGAISLVAIFYLGYVLFRAGIREGGVPDYRQPRPYSRRRPNRATSWLRFYGPGVLCLYAGTVLLFLVGGGAYRTGFLAMLIVVAGLTLAVHGYRIHPAVRRARGLEATDVSATLLTPDVRSAAFVVVGMFTVLLALGSLNTGIGIASETYRSNRRDTISQLDGELGKIVGAIEESLTTAPEGEIQQVPVPEN